VSGPGPRTRIGKPDGPEHTSGDSPHRRNRVKTRAWERTRVAGAQEYPRDFDPPTTTETNERSTMQKPSITPGKRVRYRAPHAESHRGDQVGEVVEDEFEIKGCDDAVWVRWPDEDRPLWSCAHELEVVQVAPVPGYRLLRMRRNHPEERDREGEKGAPHDDFIQTGHESFAADFPSALAELVHAGDVPDGEVIAVTWPSYGKDEGKEGGVGIRLIQVSLPDPVPVRIPLTGPELP
jgi:hypothetical protein